MDNLLLSSTPHNLKSEKSIDKIDAFLSHFYRYFAPSVYNSHNDLILQYCRGTVNLLLKLQIDRIL